MKKFRKVLLLVTAMVLGYSAVALCDWNLEDGYKMHYPQTPNPDGWDVCLCCQWIADDFTCSRTGPIDDIHFWISWRADDIGDVPDEGWDVAIYDDAEGAPGNRLWSLQNATIVVRGPFGGDQGWVCPSPVPPTIIRPDHKQYFQVNITEIEEPFIQQAKTTYWLVIRANINPEQMAIGWKTAETDEYQKPALWTLDPTDPANWVPVRETVDDIYDMAFVITGREEEPKYDFGDAPDLTPVGGGYPTLLANNGAYHVIGGPWLGDDNDMPDDEPDGQPDAAATGDDNDGNDDEDGLQLFDLTPGITNYIPVEVNGGGGYLSIWIDWNGDMDWDDAFESAYHSFGPLGDGSHLIPILPPVTSVDQTFLRARISSLSDIGPGGVAPDGEVEDHKVYIEKVNDFGDAPDIPGAPGYPTRLANNGAYHVIGGPWFGDDNDMPDAEADGQPDATATGDDNDGNDDEDGIQIPVLTQGVTGWITIQVNGGGGYLSMWLDWNGDMDWDDPGEVFSFGSPYFADGTYTIPITPQSTWVVGQTFLRARIHSSMTLPPTGGASEGEVEDHEVYIREAPEELDYGDAPDSAAAMQYPTLFASDGARHVVVPGIMLGNQIDAEPDGQPTSDADGDDLNNLDDEDGVIFTSTLIPGMPATVDVTASIAGNLHVWIDYNGDYSWAEAGDHVFAAHPIGAGTTTLGFTVPASATPGIETFARFRFTGPNVVDIGYDGYAREGEVEDYKVKIDKPIIKWSQPPTYKDEDDECFWGWNEESVYNWRQIVADDWLCMDYRPITDIHWWGSYIGWMEEVPPEPAPSRFHIGIWTDVPAGADVQWSHPGKMIWEWVVPRAELWERPVGCDFHEDYPDIVDKCFRYDLQLHEDMWFWQEGPETIYWISISAMYADVEPPERFVWGWKTREHYFNDDAVRIFNPTAPIPGDPFTSGEPIYDNAGTSWDMAFELTTQECLTPVTAVFPPLHPSAGVNYYSEWVNVGYPKCWCYARQCWGDADGLMFSGKWVLSPDLGIFLGAWNKNVGDPGFDICADFDHALFSGKRVLSPDLAIFLASWNQDPIPPNCGGTTSP